MCTMGTYKRRVIYMSDTEWSALDSEAHDRRTTISAVIRHAVHLRDHPGDQAWSKANQTVPLAEREVTNSGFRSRPFTPVPKKGK
jgi:hypothetical protein